MDCLGEKENHILLIVFEFLTGEQIDVWIRRVCFV